VCPGRRTGAPAVRPERTEVPDVDRPHPASPGNPQRLQRRHSRRAPLVVALAALLGLVGALVALRSEAAGRPVVVAARDLVPGARLTAADVRTVAVAAPGSVLAHLVAGDAAWRGRVVTAPVAAGEPVTRTRLRPAATDDGRRVMSIPVDRARAVDGRLRPGDRVDVVQALDGTAAVVAAGLEVLAVADDADGALGASRGRLTVTLAVDVAESQRLTGALADGEFVLTRVTGAAPGVGAAPVGVGRTGSVAR